MKLFEQKENGIFKIIKENLDDIIDSFAEDPFARDIPCELRKHPKIIAAQIKNLSELYDEISNDEYIADLFHKEKHGPQIGKISSDERDVMDTFGINRTKISNLKVELENTAKKLNFSFKEDPESKETKQLQKKIESLYQEIEQLEQNQSVDIGKSVRRVFKGWEEALSTKFDIGDIDIKIKIMYEDIKKRRLPKKRFINKWRDTLGQEPLDCYQERRKKEQEERNKESEERLRKQNIRIRKTLNRNRKMGF